MKQLICMKDKCKCKLLHIWRSPPQEIPQKTRCAACMWWHASSPSTVKAGDSVCGPLQPRDPLRWWHFPPYMPLYCPLHFRSRLLGHDWETEIMMTCLNNDFTRLVNAEDLVAPHTPDGGTVLGAVGPSGLLYSAGITEERAKTPSQRCGFPLVAPYTFQMGLSVAFLFATRKQSSLLPHAGSGIAKETDARGPWLFSTFDTKDVYKLP